jgi:hypothetical protein
MFMAFSFTLELGIHNVHGQPEKYDVCEDSLCFIIHSISCNLTQGLYPPHVSVAAPDAEHQQQ